MSSSQQEPIAGAKKPLQFSLRFVLGVVTGVALLCAFAKTIGAWFWGLVFVVVALSSWLAIVAAGWSLVLLIVVALLPDPYNGRAKAIQTIYRVFVWSLLWFAASVLLLMGGSSVFAGFH